MTDADIQALPWDKPDPFIWRVRIKPEHIDDFNHTNNVVYLTFMAKTAWEHSKALGLDFEAYRELGKGVVVRRHEMDYLAASFADEEIACATWITQNDGRLRLRRRFQFIATGRRKTIFRGLSDFVCIDLKSGKASRMPDAFIKGYEVTAVWDGDSD